MTKINRCIDIEIRKKDTESGNIVEGVACVFNKKTNIGWFTESIDSRAFDECDMSDVVLLFNHDPNYVLASTRNKSLSLNITDKGLEQVSQIVDTTQGRDVLKLVQEGLINKMSFAFSVSEDGEKWSKQKGKDHRTIMKIKKLHDVSLVTNPAYSQTSAFARDDELANKHLDKLKRQRQNERMEELTNV